MLVYDHAGGGKAHRSLRALRQLNTTEEGISPNLLISHSTHSELLHDSVQTLQHLLQHSRLLLLFTELTETRQSLLSIDLSSTHQS